MTTELVNLEQMKQLLLRCQSSSMFFIENFCRVQHPTAGILPFKLFKYQRTSLKAFLTYRWNIYRKCRQCFRGDSMVWTPFGPKRIDSIKAGDLIYSLDEITNSLVIVPVESVHHNGTSDNCVEVRTKTGHRSICTLDHEFKTKDGYKPVDMLTLNDCLIEVNDVQRYGRSANQSEVILLAYFLTDGYCGNKAHHFTNTRWKYLLEFQKHYELRFGVKLPIKPHKNSGFGCENASRLYSYNKNCRTWLKELGILGLTKSAKVIPDIVFTWDNDSIALLINRMFAADGWYSGGHCNEAGIGQISIRILYQLRQLLTRFGINAQVYPATDASIPKLRIMGGRDFDLFTKYIGIFGKEQRQEITKGFFFNRKRGELKSITRISGNHDVYDLTVSPNHNYIVDGTVVHNCGISTLAGGFVLWYAMFFPHKTILIVSKRDLDAMAFLNKNVKFVYEHLPEEFKAIYGNPPPIWNEHTVGFANGSVIKSLTSHKETLRSNSASLNIIDESAFMPHMVEMWSAGQQTLVHGGSVIVISTCNGFDAWYQPTFEDAINKRNDFNPIVINWWDMDWEIKYRDELSGKECKIAPTEGIRKCETKEELEKWGPYYSPWLEEQYRQLQLKGEVHKFRQEVLAEFVGTGNTVLDRVALLAIEKQVDDNYSVVGRVGYIHPVTGERLNIDFENQLWIWKKPVKPEPDLIENGRVIRPGRPGHTYSMGVDIASGEADDFDAIEVIDTNTHEQVAELYLKVQPNVLLMMIDYIGRWYNGAYCVPERTGMGIPVCQDLYATIGYSNLYRMALPSGKRSKKVGFPTSPVYKPTLNKALVDMLGEDGVHVYSRRLLQQLYIYIHTGKNKTGHVEGPGNHSDLSIATALALVGIGEAVQADTTSMVPMRSVPTDMPDPKVVKPSEIMELASSGGMSALMPIIIGPQGNDRRVLSPQEEIMQFAAQLGGLPINARGANPAFIQRKHIIQYPHQS